MSEDTLLTNSVFGGYNKRNVVQYIDSLLVENEQKRKDLEQQILLLTQENNRLKDQTRFFPAKQPDPQLIETSSTTAKPVKLSHMSLETEQETDMDANVQGINLPEGTYMVSKDHGVTKLPVPEPVYHTRKKGSLVDPAAILEEDLLVPRQKGENSSLSASLETSAQSQAADSVMRNTPPSSGFPAKPPLPEKGMEQPNHADTANAEKYPSESTILEKINVLEKDVIMLKEALRTEKKKKQALAAKLEYSTDLLIQLYKSR